MANVLPSDELTDEPSDFGALRPSTRLGRYELLVPIARGGMARVWAARQHGQRGFQKLVAIKTILPHLAEETDFERMFLDEARIASWVHHPNVCEIYDLGEDNRTLYLAMEWVNGDSLSRVLRASGKTEALDPRVAARILADACAGVHAAHEQTDDDGRPLEVVHRDLSPHNVLLTTDGVAKVCDFGVAKALGQLHDQTSAGQLKGKISYMAPEQIAGAPIDRRSDVFSLGCALYEATTGVRPFRGEQAHMVLHAILSGELQPPTSVVRNYPPELERIVLRALAHRPVLRFPTAERMRFALEEFLAKGRLVTQSDVAQVVSTRLGEQLEHRKERIKQASRAVGLGGWESTGSGMTRDAVDHLSGVNPSRYPSASTFPPVSGVYGPRRSVPPARFVEAQQAQAGAAHYVLAAFVGLLCALLIGGGGYLVWQARAKVAAPSPPTEIAPPPVEIASAVVVAIELAVRVAPADAILIVDGVELPPGTRSIPRPVEGQTVTLLVRAEGYEDASIAIDASTEEPIAIALRPSGEDTARPVSTSAALPSASAVKAPPKPRPQAPRVLPDNPY